MYNKSHAWLGPPATKPPHQTPMTSSSALEAQIETLSAALEGGERLHAALGTELERLGADLATARTRRLEAASGEAIAAAESAQVGARLARLRHATERDNGRHRDVKSELESGRRRDATVRSAWDEVEYALATGVMAVHRAKAAAHPLGVHADESASPSVLASLTAQGTVHCRRACSVAKE